jgi:hypothetical protein
MMNTPVGYLLKRHDGLAGDRGLYYNYILAANGLFIEAENSLIAARVPVAECEIRGLAPVEPKISAVMRAELRAIPGAFRIPIALQLGIDGRVMTLAAVLALLTVLVFGLFPALQVSRPDLSAALQERTGTGALSKGSRLRSGGKE